MKPALAATALLSACVLSGCLGKSEPVPPETPAESDPPPAQVTLQIAPEALAAGRIQLGRPETAELPELLEVTARIGLDENRTVRVGSVVEGRIISVHANVGDQVRRSDRLAFLHSREAHEARADHAQAVARVRQQEAALEFARQAHERAERLYQLKAGSLENVQRTRADLEGAKKALEVAQTEVGRELEHLHHLGIQPLEDAARSAVPGRPPGIFEEDELVPVVASQSGTVLERLVTPGTVVTPADDLFVISDLRRLWVHAQVPERHLSPLKVGQDVKVGVRAYPEKVFRARIRQIADVMDPTTRTALVLCQIDNPDSRLKAEMYATVSFELSGGEPTLVVPAGALQSLEAETVVFLHLGQGRFRFRVVQPGRRLDGRVEIRQGLEAGQEIAVAGSFLLKSELLRAQLSDEH